MEIASKRHKTLKKKPRNPQLSFSKKCFGKLKEYSFHEQEKGNGEIKWPHR